MIRFSVLLILVLTCAVPCFADEAQNIRIAKSMVEAINARDLDRLDQLIAQDMVRHSAATAGVTITSLDDFKAFLQTDFAAIPDSKMSIDVIFGNNEFVALRAIYSGTQTGAMGPFPPSGKKVELPFIGILRISEGAISEMWVEWDNIFMLSALGHLQPPSNTPE